MLGGVTETAIATCIRAATLDDLPQLAGLLSVLFAQEAEFAPDADRQVRALEQLLKAPASASVLCASRGRKLVGMVSLQYVVSTAEGGRVAWLEDMVVSAAERGRGLGERLLRAATDEARRAQCSRITLLTDASNEGAQRFYSRAGFSRSPMVPLRVKLAAPRSA